ARRGGALADVAGRARGGEAPVGAAGGLLHAALLLAARRALGRAGGALVGAGAVHHARAAAADLVGVAHRGADPVGAAGGEHLALHDAAGVGAGLHALGALVGAGRHAAAAAAHQAVGAGGGRAEALAA